MNFSNVKPYGKSIKNSTDDEGNFVTTRTENTYAIKTILKNGSAYIYPEFFVSDQKEIIEELATDLVTADRTVKELAACLAEVKVMLADMKPDAIAMETRLEKSEAMKRTFAATIDEIVARGYISGEQAMEIYNEKSSQNTAQRK